MKKAVAARLQGDDYQIRFFWMQVCRLFEDRTKVVSVELESDDVKSLDDVVVRYKDYSEMGEPIDADFFQVKFHVTSNGAFTWRQMMDPSFVNASSVSILQRLLNAQRKHAPKGYGCRFNIYSPWTVQDGGWVMIVTALKFRTADARFGLSIDGSILEKMLKLCREATNAETGGILVGHYTQNHDWATVTDISGPPKDSGRAHASFIRGVKGLQNWLNHIWGSSHHYYLGEWHYHPFANAEASLVDAKQLKEHSENGPLMCPEPVMLIVGGDPNGLWEAKAYVYPKGKGLCTMDKLEPMSPTPC